MAKGSATKSVLAIPMTIPEKEAFAAYSLGSVVSKAEKKIVSSPVATFRRG